MLMMCAHLHEVICRTERRPRPTPSAVVYRARTAVRTSRDVNKTKAFDGVERGTGRVVTGSKCRQIHWMVSTNGCKKLLRISPYTHIYMQWTINAGCVVVAQSRWEEVQKQDLIAGMKSETAVNYHAILKVNKS